jgi:hypothetical protein
MPALNRVNLSRNDIGKQFQGQGSGSSIGLLIEINRPIQVLDLSWNSIRGVAAESMGQALATNCFLTSIELVRAHLAHTVRAQSLDTGPLAAQLVRCLLACRAGILLAMRLLAGSLVRTHCETIFRCIDSNQV